MAISRAWWAARSRHSARNVIREEEARRWVAEACHGWFNRFRKLLARCEKLEHTFLALNHLGAGVIALRKTSLPVNIIYG